MNLIELNRALRQLRLGGIAAVLETRIHQAQAEAMPPIDFLSCLVSDELTRRGERLLERRKKQAEFRDPQKTLDNFDFNFNRKMNRSLVFDLATGAFIARHEDGLFLGPPGTGKSHLAQAIGQAAVQQGYRVLYRETHKLLDDLAEATIDGTRKETMELFVSVPLLIIGDLGGWNRQIHNEAAGRPVDVGLHSGGRLGREILLRISAKTVISVGREPPIETIAVTGEKPGQRGSGLRKPVPAGVFSEEAGAL